MKLYHWMTKSYARHKAADYAVDKISELGDSFMETYIGKYGTPTMTKRDMTITLNPYNDDTMIKYLDECIKFLLTNVPSVLKKDDVDLLNIRDEMVSALNQTKYLMSLS
jgi:hypothetical protein